MNNTPLTPSVTATSGYSFQCVLPRQNFTQAEIGHDVRPYRLLGACNPPLAHRELTAQPDIGFLLPCNVVVREEVDGRLAVSFMDPVAVLQMTSNPDVAAVAKEVRARLERVRSVLSAAGSA